MKFKQLTEKDKGLICERYLDGKREDADMFLSRFFNVSERTVRNWARKLKLTAGSTKPRVIGELAQPIFYEEGGKRVLVVGDLHTPFDLTEYLYHLKKVYDMYQCDTVVFIGDIVDNHYSSFHGTDPDGMGGGDELDYSKKRVARYREVFPKAYVIIGNHDRMAARKAFAGGIPKQWLKSYNEVLEVPDWKFVTELELDDVLYFHGEGGTAKTKMLSEQQSTVQGHLHTQAYIHWAFSKKMRIFGMQVGTGIDFDEYAFAYAKAGKKPAISCGVVLNGKQPILVPMDL